MTIYVLVEGVNDEQLLKAVFKKCFNSTPSFYQYASKSPETVMSFVKGLCNEGVLHILLADKNASASITEKKNSKAAKYGTSAENTIIVDNERAGMLQEPPSKSLIQRATSQSRLTSGGLNL